MLPGTLLMVSSVCVCVFYGFPSGHCCVWFECMWWLPERKVRLLDQRIYIDGGGSCTIKKRLFGA